MHKHFRHGGCEGVSRGFAAMGWGGRGRGWRSWGGDWGDDWGGPGGRRGRRRQFDSSELRLILLKLIADQPRHGYDLIRAIEELSRGEYAPSPGVVYPTLTLLNDMGFIEQVEAEGARKAFAATAEGRAHLDEKTEEVRALFERLEGLGAQQRMADAAPVARAVKNLLSALWHRVTRGDLDEEQLHAIAAILDEAAQKIERLKSS
jgi:DNA-binding PadR family transcriptional regulator